MSKKPEDIMMNNRKLTGTLLKKIADLLMESVDGMDEDEGMFVIVHVCTTLCAFPMVNLDRDEQREYVKRVGGIATEAAESFRRSLSKSGH